MRPVLQLVRLPNVFTAPADSLAGWLIVGGALADLRGWLPVGGASMCLYAAGMALNDWYDLEVDRAERPDRPLPSGAVPVGLAATIGWGGLVAGLALASLAGPAMIIAGMLALAIVFYDAWAKKTWVGPWAMGACRGLNLLMGIVAARAPDRPAAWVGAFAFGLFVAGVTWISRSEAFGGATRNLRLGLWLQRVAVVLLGVAVLTLADPLDRAATFAGVFVLAAVAFKVFAAGARALREPSPGMVQRAVKTGVLALVWLDVALVAAACGPVPALAVAAFWIPAYLLARVLYAT
ncbi:UbiA family prenyltransferase [Paludisphaera sp.]|uniref:UbiA family prenyltransferase n=1 Tax=Paludisphaera sp. TaxID=2017432 RepID=UPI00301C80E2